MKRPTRPRPLARRTLPSGLPRTVRDRGSLALRAAPRLRGIGSLAITPEAVNDIPLPAALIPNATLPALPVISASAPEGRSGETSPKLAGNRASVGGPIAPPQVAPEIRPDRDAMTLRGEYWDISFNQKQGVVPDSRGLRYLALLVRDTSGGRSPIHAKELTALATGKPSGAIELETEQAVLDTKARKELMQRMEELAFERDRAVAVDDLARAERLDDEYEQIADELGRAGGTRGATRRKTAFVHDGEKARKAVAKAIAEAIAKIADHPQLSALAEHFTSSVRKGQWLSYTGSSDWHVDFTAPPPRK